MGIKWILSGKMSNDSDHSIEAILCDIDDTLVETSQFVKQLQHKISKYLESMI